MLRVIYGNGNTLLGTLSFPKCNERCNRMPVMDEKTDDSQDFKIQDSNWSYKSLKGTHRQHSKCC